MKDPANTVLCNMTDLLRDWQYRFNIADSDPGSFTESDSNPEDALMVCF